MLGAIWDFCSLNHRVWIISDNQKQTDGQIDWTTGGRREKTSREKSKNRQAKHFVIRAADRQTHMTEERKVRKEEMKAGGKGGRQWSESREERRKTERHPSQQDGPAWAACAVCGVPFAPALLQTLSIFNEPLTKLWEKRCWELFCTPTHQTVTTQYFSLS